ncbi:Uu.00g137390.m01.CDS01 [Anthostomella pinea]|uniref:Uu.00g137390.m01.CDS01 n=1 Tax=Anthostomella pinea TaxID=933095 RepID=A0AAI8VQF5_9PEZI|nr:Uu.00g137390.m01.CDS01 [Anthostomella pinea]
MGTQVTYNDGQEGARRNFHWIVGGHDILKHKSSIIVRVPNTISFQIMVPFYNPQSPEYVAKINRFKQGTATAEGLLNDLGLSFPPTRRDTGANTPGTGDIHLQKKLGEGSFGVVTHLWNVSTGYEHVVKAPSAKAIRKQKFNTFLTPHPQLHMEYVPCGPLGDLEDVLYNETWMILRQCLSALSYLHGNHTPIAHRDIKPANILVQFREAGDIYVKLGDFGLSRDGAELMTLCGTRRYLAPEVYSEAGRHSRKENRLGYIAAVDIWSLGVVAYELIYGLPPYKRKYDNDGVLWCEKISIELQKNVGKQSNELGQFLADAMVVLDTESRFSAANCYKQVEYLLATENGSFQSHTSTPASHYPDEGQTTFRNALPNYGSGDPTLMVYQPMSHMETNTSSHFTRSGAPPPGLPSSLVVMTQQYEEPSSSAIRGNFNQQEGHDQYVQGSSSQWNPSTAWARAAGSETGRDAGPSRSSVPRDEEAGRHAAGGTGVIKGRNAIGADDYAEMAAAAFLLQALGQGS